MGKDNIRYKTGLTDVAETYVDVINSSSDISQIGTQIMGMNFLHEQAINQNDPDALEILREATPHFRTILKGLESFVHSLETGKRTNTKDLTPLIDKNKPEELADFLVVAARLIFLKSHNLLQYVNPQEEDNGPALADQLKLYKQYVEASKTINIL